MLDADDIGQNADDIGQNADDIGYFADDVGDQITTQSIVGTIEKCLLGFTYNIVISLYYNITEGRGRFAPRPLKSSGAV